MKSERSSRSHQTRADFIAPKVRYGFKETTASDMYSLGKMLQRAVYGRSFNNLFSRIIFQATTSSCLERPFVRELIILLEKVG